MPRYIPSYDDFLIDCRRQIKRTAEKTGISWPDFSDCSKTRIDEFLTNELRHERFSLGDISNHAKVVPLACDTYEILMDIVANGENKQLRARYYLSGLRSGKNDIDNFANL